MTSDAILVVDDDDNVRDLVARYLNAQGYRTSAAASGEEAISHLDRHDLDLVITDLRMPGMDGLDLARKSLAADPDRPVMVMTAFADVDNARQSISVGIYDFLVKPFDFKDLQMAVDRTLDHRRLVLQNRAYQRSLEWMVEERTRELQEALSRLERKVKELEGRDRINQHLVTVHTLEETLSRVLEAIQGALGVERVVIFLSDTSGERLEPAIGAGVQAPEDLASSQTLRRLSAPWMEEAKVAAYRVFLEGRVVEEKDLSERCSIAVPMLRLGDALGAVFVQNPFSGQPLAREDLQTLVNLTTQAAVAISDAELYGNSKLWRATMENIEGLLPNIDTS